MRYRFGRAELCTLSRELRVNGVPVALGGRAFDLLQALLERRERVVSTGELLSLVWPGLAVQPNNLQVQVWALRSLLGAQAILTVPRRGYRIGEVVQVLGPLPHAGHPDAPAPLRQVPAPAPEGHAGWFIDVAQACAELAPGRLVTLVGPHEGSRRALAKAVAQHLSRYLAMGAWYLEGAQLRDIGATPGRLEQALARLARRDALLVMYDVHLAPERAVALLHSLGSAPLQVQLLATSNHALGLPGERVHEAPSRVLQAGHEPAAVPGHLLRWHPRPAGGAGARGG